MLKTLSSMTPLVVYAFQMYCTWYIFEKANQPTWASLVPFYSDYIYFKIAKQTKAFKWYLTGILGIIGSVVAIFVGIAVIAISDGEVNSAVSMMLVLLLVIVVFGIILLVAYGKMCKGLSDAFGLNEGFAVGLFLLPIVFRALLAIDENNQYLFDPEQ